MVYDGVYASESERKKGAGLNLIANFCKWLGIDESFISGQHDISHNYQLAFKDVIDVDKSLQKLLKFVYDVMTTFNIGKSKTKFEEFCDEHNHPFLTNKRRQDTRFVRSDLRSLETFTRNLTAYYHWFGKSLVMAIQRKDNTSSKEYLSKLNKLSSGSNIAYLIGYVSLLQCFSEGSVAGQSGKHFATTIFESILKLERELQSLADEWKWNESSLRFTSIQPPKRIIEMMMNEGIFRVELSAGAQLYHKKRMTSKRKQKEELSENLRSAGLDEEWISKFTKVNIDYNLDDSESSDNEGDADDDSEEDEDNGEMISSHQEFDLNEIPVQDFGKNDLEKVEQELSSLAKRLHDSLKKRMQLNQVTIAAYEAFVEVDFIKQENFIDDAKIRLYNVFETLRIYNGERFVMSECLTGYLQFLKERKNIMDQHLEVFYKKFSSKYSEDDMVLPFMQLFEVLQLKSFSEAVCENVGSLMDSYRNLEPDNLNKEAYFRFNSPPLHILRQKVIKEIVEEKLNVIDEHYYISKNAKRNIFKETGSVVGHFREDLENNSHLPISIFEK